MPVEQLFGVGLILLLGSLLQSAIGFGYTLFALPLLVWLGLPLSEGVAVIAVSNLIQGTVGVVRLKHHVPWRTVGYATAIRYLALPLGIATLVVVDGLDQANAKAILGAVLLLVLLVQWLWKVEPREKLHPGWGWLAFLSSGFLQGLASIGGPPIVLWVMAHKWSNPTSRVFLFALLPLSTPFQLTLLFLNYGPPILTTFLTGVAFIPVIALGSLVGVRLGNRIPKPMLRAASYGILLIIAVTSIVAPLLNG